jgi:predicted component of type VI protein secretion system
MTTTTPSYESSMSALREHSAAVARATQAALDVLIDDIDGSLDTLVGEPAFSNAQVRKALEGIGQRIGYCIESLDDKS